MEDLVIMHNQQIVTTSLKVAEVFKKNHRDVMEKIRNMSAENSAVLNMFVEDEYTNSQNKQQPMYYMNRDGFTLLAMSFTGSKAMEFKLKYIDAFNKMEQVIRQGLPQTPEEKLALTMQVTLRLDKRVGELEKSVIEIQNKQEINSDQRYKLWITRNRKAVEVLGGKDSNAYQDKKLTRKVFRALERELKDEFTISRYEDLRRDEFDSAIEFINNWHPSYSLEREISLKNSQMKII